MRKRVEARGTNGSNVFARRGPLSDRASEKGAYTSPPGSTQYLEDSVQMKGRSLKALVGTDTPAMESAIRYLLLFL